jgi:chromosome condensin MukBEF complex kleisin-like MukF subunit
MGKSEKVIAFRLTSDALELAEEAAKRRSVTVNELARDAFLASLSSEGDIHKVALRVTNIESEVSELRRDLAVATQAILVTSGKVSPEEAEKFAREKLGKG